MFHLHCRSGVEIEARNKKWEALRFPIVCRHRRDLNSRGQSPLAFKTNSLTTRTRCLQRGVRWGVVSHRQTKSHRHRRDLNSRGQSPVDFESTSLTTRTRCLAREETVQARHTSCKANTKTDSTQKRGRIANPSFDLGTFRL